MLLARWEVSGEQPEALKDHPSLAPHFPWVWNWFLSMRPGRGLSWSDLDAWARRSGAKPTGWECELLMRLDQLRFN